VNLQCKASTEDINLGVIPVTVIGPTGEYKTFALLDSGAKNTFVDATVAAEVGAKGPRKSMRVLGFSEKANVNNYAQRVKIKIRDPSRDTYNLSNVVSKKNLRLPTQTVDCKELREKFLHLEDVPLYPMQNVVPTILIGQDNFELMAHRRIIEGRQGEPAATLTRLGWVVEGRVTPVFDPNNASVVMFQTEDDQAEDVNALMKEYWNMDTWGIANEWGKSILSVSILVTWTPHQCLLLPK